MKQYKLCTIREFAEYVTNEIEGLSYTNSGMYYNADISNYDFAVVYDYENKGNLEAIAQEAECWYGLKKLDTEFDNVELYLISDYYGGGAVQVSMICEEYKHNIIRQKIENMVTKTINSYEVTDENSTLIIEFEEVKEND